MLLKSIRKYEKRKHKNQVNKQTNRQYDVKKNSPKRETQACFDINNNNNMRCEGMKKAYSNRKISYSSEQVGNKERLYIKQMKIESHTQMNYEIKSNVNIVGVI